MVKGVSADEKRKRLLDWFYEKQDFFQQKEVEKGGHKEKGIILQAVPEVLQQLIDDGLVEKDKIGTSNYFWAFPSTGMQKRRNKLDKLQADLAAAKRTKADAEARATELASSRAESSDRAALAERLAALEKEREDVNAELAKYADNDPKRFDEIVAGTTVLRDSANRHTDNVFVMRNWCVQSLGRTMDEINNAMGLPDDLDYVP